MSLPQVIIVIVKFAKKAAAEVIDTTGWPLILIKVPVV